MFANQVTKVVTVSFGPVTIQKLSWLSLQNAREAQRIADEIRLVRTSRAMREAGISIGDEARQHAKTSPPAATAPVASSGAAETPAAADQAAAGVASPAPAPETVLAPEVEQQLLVIRKQIRNGVYDLGTVLHAGIKSWPADAKVTREAVEALTQEDANELFIEILDLSLPPLDPAVVQEERKNA
jgi:hypothetical protein